jgi:hypothetical protein
VAGAFTSCAAIGWALDTTGGTWWGLGYTACHYPGRNQSTATFDNLAKQYGFSGCKHIYDSSGDHFFACRYGVQEIEAKVCVPDAKAFNMQRACPVGQYKVGYEADGMPICKDPCPTVSCLDRPGWYFDSTGSGWAHGRPFCGAAYRNDDKRFIEDARDMGFFLCSIEIDHSGDRFYVCDKGFKEAYKAGQCANPNEIVP